MRVTVATAGMTAAVDVTARPRFLVGARFQYGTATSDATDFAVGSALLGVPAFTRLFYAGQSVHAHIGPASTINIVSFKPAQRGADLSSYIGSLCPQDRLVCHHEPEADYPSGAAFLTAWRAAKAMAKALRPDLPFGMIAGAFQYREGNAGVGGAFIPDAGEADFLGLDTYRIGLGAASQTTPQAVNRCDPIETLPEFVEWMRCTEGRGPRIVTEYNRGLDKDAAGSTIPGNIPLRLAVLERDADTLATLGFEGVGLWHAEGTSATKRWAWRDPESVAAWRRISTKYA